MAKKKQTLSIEEKLENAIVPENEHPYKIPENWVWTRLGDVFEVERGGSPRPIEKFLTDESDGINWIKIGDTNKDSKYINFTKEKIIKEGLKKSRFVTKGDLLLTNSMSFGRPYILNCDGCIHDGWLVFRTIKEINKEYFYYLMSSPYMYNSFSLLAKGSTVRNLNKDMVKSATIPFPPFSEQERIVNTIEKLFEKLDSAKEKIEEALSSFENRKTALLYQAFSGQLTKNWRKENQKDFDKKAYFSQFLKDEDIITENIPYEIPENWVWTRLKIVSNIINGDRGSNYPSKEDYMEEGVHFIHAGALKNGSIDYNSTYKISENKYNSLRAGKVLINDILYCLRGSLGKNAIINDKNITGAIASSLCIIRGTKEINPLGLFYYLNSYFGIKQIYISDNGTAQPNLSASDLKEFTVPLPPLEEQAEIVRILDNILEKEKESKELISMLDNIDLIKKSILAKAFRGELGTNNPIEESAINLLREVLSRE